MEAGILGATGTTTVHYKDQKTNRINFIQNVHESSSSSFLSTYKVLDIGYLCLKYTCFAHLQWAGLGQLAANTHNFCQLLLVEDCGSSQEL